ncbi:MAG: sigma-70 family RNA polymerase sigma factor [Acidaminococcaceae bacterium]|nr:sigma-70 family RNA polymerase sigma factor [Acidaminococcaceae bacterium]
MRELVLSAQSGNSAATELLCRTFKPLIRQEIRGYVSRILGEDAENTAWEIFLTFIVNYRGWDYRRLPGLIKSHLHYELLHAVAKEINQAEPFDPELYDEEQTAACSELNSAEVRLLLDDCMCKLTPKQKLFVDSVCLGGKTLREAGAAFGCTPQNSYKHLSRGLETLRRELLT